MKIIIQREPLFGQFRVKIHYGHSRPDKELWFATVVEARDFVASRTRYTVCEVVDLVRDGPGIDSGRAGEGSGGDPVSPTARDPRSCM